MADPVPQELKPVSGFLQRARELEGRDPVIRYYCLYHAANVAMNLSPTADDSRAFMLHLLDQLEALKSSLSDQEAVTNDIVAQAYVTNFADRVFSGADNEDRQGNASRATAKKFLAASNFLELLADFGPLDEEVQERIRYSKWKASDIAKALKEGRQPTPGNGQEQAPAEGVDSISQTVGLENAEPQEVSVTQDEGTPATAGKTESEQEVELALLASQTAAAVEASSPTGGHAEALPEPPQDPLSAFPSAVLPSVPTEPSAPANDFQTPASDSASPAPTFSEIPSAPALDLPPRSPDRMQTPINQQPPSLPRPTTPAAQRTYHASPMVSAGSPPPPLPVAHPQPFAYEEPSPALDPKTVAQTQKHAKFAISALNYDDVAEAKKQLTQALALLGS